MKNSIVKTLLRVMLLSVLLAVFGAVVAQDAVLTVDAAQDEGAISPFVYGANYGPPAAVSLDLLDEAQNSGIRYFRIPAGRWGDDNDLTTIFIDTYYNQAVQWGAELAISMRMQGSGGTVEKAAELVRYTMEKGYNVRYWALGNEPNLIDFYEGGESNTDFSQFRMEEYNRDWREMAEAMLAVNPDLVLVGPDVSQFPPTREGDPYNNPLREWVREFLRANGDLVDIVAVHRYPFPINNQATTIEQARLNPPEWDVLVENLREVIRDVMGKDMPIAITEANSHWSNSGNGEASPDSFYNAIWWADVLGRLIVQKVEIVGYFAFQSAGSNGAFGLLERYGVRPTYYTYQLYKQFGSQLVHSESADNDVRIYAAKRDDGTLTLLVINLGPDEATRTLSLSGFTPSGDAEVWRFDSEHNAEQIDSQAVADGGSLTVPGQSITLYVLPGA